MDWVSDAVKNMACTSTAICTKARATSVIHLATSCLLKIKRNQLSKSKPSRWLSEILFLVYIFQSLKCFPNHFFGVLWEQIWGLAMWETKDCLAFWAAYFIVYFNCVLWHISINIVVLLTFCIQDPLLIFELLVSIYNIKINTISFLRGKDT